MMVGERSFGVVAITLAACVVLGNAVRPVPVAAQESEVAPSPGDAVRPEAVAAAAAAEPSGADADADAGGEVASPEDAAQAEADRAYAEQMRRRADLTRWHRPLGIATWVSMGITVALGFFRYHDLYGFFANQGGNPCVQGNALFGQESCVEPPALHLASSLLTTALYASTFTVSLMMPDPDDSSSGDSAFASRLRTHKILRWVHFGGMVAQMLLGIVMANGVLGLDRANDYGTLQALATVHMGLGLVTFGALTWAGALMTF